MTNAVFNKVSDCCHMSIINGRRAEYPLGGSTFRQVYEVEYCESCGKDCSSVDQCEVCGVVGCLRDCDKEVTT